jgi:hypothetical protein
MKTSWLDNTLQVNAAAFNYDYTDLQVFVLQPIAAGSPAALYPCKAMRATPLTVAERIELELLPAAGWLISGTVGYVHAIFTKFDTETRHSAQPNETDLSRESWCVAIAMHEQRP